MLDIIPNSVIYISKAYIPLGGSGLGFSVALHVSVISTLRYLARLAKFGDFQYAPSVAISLNSFSSI
jgi:hypothetical protein